MRVLRGIITSINMFLSQRLLFTKGNFYLGAEITIKPMKMKSCFLALAILIYSLPLQAQLRSTPYCPPLHLDILDGTVSKMYPQSPFGDIINRLPCYTEAVDELSTGGCGGVYFKDKAVYFHTYRDYIEIKENYNGTMSMPLMGTNRNNLFKWLGIPAKKDIKWESYQMRYGSLVLFFDAAGKVNNIIITSKNAESLNMCE